MKSKGCCSAAPVLALALLGAALICPSPAQQFRRNVQAASVLPPSAVKLTPGGALDIPLKIIIRPGFHINSSKPAEDYLIPTRLTWQTDAWKPESIEYPEAETVNYEFSEKPLSVYSGTIVVRSMFAVPDPAPSGLTELTGKLRYQACNEKACFPPVNVDVTVPVAP